MPGPKSKFETFLVKMATVEALQDPFFHMYTFASDDENFKSLDVSNFISSTYSVLQIQFR